MNVNYYPLKGMDSASCVINGQTLIVQARDKKLFVLNGAGTRIWELSDGQHAVEDIIRKLRLKSKKSEQQLRKEIEDFIEELVSREVLVLLSRPLDAVA